MSRAIRSRARGPRLVLLVGRGMAGCADGIVLGHAPSSETSDVADDAGAGAAEAGASDCGSAAPPTCSVDGWCYTRLPAAQSASRGDVLPDPSGVRFALSSVWVSPDHQRVGRAARRGTCSGGTAPEWRVELVAGAGAEQRLGLEREPTCRIAGDAGLLLHGTDSGWSA